MQYFLRTKTRTKDSRIQHLGLSLLLASLLMLPVWVFGQEARTITGTITDTDGDIPIPGVNVSIKGTTVGTITNIDGHFEIQAAASDILVISFIGYDTQEKTVGTQTDLKIGLSASVTDIDEVVVIGYGVQKKKLLTGATAQVNGDKLEKRNSTSAMQALQGQAAGVNITSTSGQPGEGMKVTIRGVGTTGNSSPLFLVDGVITGSIDYLNPADIESIDVLKDAASTAIYGSRAANGVVLITTKQGKAGKSQVSFDAYYGVQNVAKNYELLNTEDYVMIMNEQELNSGGTVATLPFNANDLPAYTSDGVADTDWLDEMFVRNALTKNYVLGVTGGNEQTVYSTSVSYTAQEGIVGGADYSNYERYNGRFNSESKLYNGRVKVGQHLTFSYTQNSGISVGGNYNNTLRGAFNVSPLHPVYDDEGNFFNVADETLVDQNGESYWNNAEGNPYGSMVLNSQNINKHQKLLGDVYTEIEIIDNLKFRSSYGIDYYGGQTRSYSPVYELSIYSFAATNSASQNMSTSLGMKWDNYLSYDFDIGLHNFKVMAGTSVERYTGEWLYTKNTNVNFDDLEHAYIDNTTNVDGANITIQGAPNDEEKILSSFGRLQYNYGEKYMLNGVLRYDANSKFAPGYRSDFFPSLSAGWVLTNESFAASMVQYVQFLKLRASYGKNGNSNLKAFQYMAPIAFTNATYPFGDEEGTAINGSYPERLDNEEIRWEKTVQTNIGFDARMLDSKMSVNFDWYKKTSQDWLVVAPLLLTAGADAPYMNGGNAINQGVELAIGYQNRAGDFSYSVNVNGAYNKNEVQDIPTEDGIIHGGTNELYNNAEEFYRAESGHAIGYFWGLETDGIFQNSGEVSGYTTSDGTVIQPNAKPGDLRYVDQNGDGVIDEDDKVDIGDPNPDFIFGLSLNLSYKGFDFSVLGNGVAGNQIVQSYRNQGDKYANYGTEILGRWTGEGTSDEIPRVTNNNVNYKFSDIYVQDGAYFRISNVTLGFDVASVTDVKWLGQCRVYAQVQNLYTFTKYNGMDPEVGFGYTDDDAGTAFASGIDMGYYPRPRTILFGINLKF